MSSLTDEQREALCICDYAHDTRDAADNAALKGGCERFQGHVAALLTAARAEGAEKARAEVEALADEWDAKGDALWDKWPGGQAPRSELLAAGHHLHANDLRAALAGGEL